MELVASYPTAHGANVTVSRSTLTPGSSWVVNCDSCNQPRGYIGKPTALGRAAAHAAKCGGQPPTIPGTGAIIITGWSAS